MLPGLGLLGLVLGLLGLASACPSPFSPRPEPPDPGEPDDGGTVLIERDPACTLTGSLTLGLGQGDGTQDFRPLEPGQGPTLYYGSQGGMHVILGVSVANPATEFPGMQVRFIAEAQFCDFNGCQPYAEMGRYLTVVRQDRYIAQPEGAIALSGFLVVLQAWPPNTLRRITAEVIDRCGRMGTTSLEIAPGTP
jgi:hypothetical protein